MYIYCFYVYVFIIALKIIKNNQKEKERSYVINKNVV